MPIFRGKGAREANHATSRSVANTSGAMVAAPYGAAAQTAAKTYRIGTLTVTAPIAPTDGPGALLIAGLAQRGYTLGQNLAYEIAAQRARSARCRIWCRN